MDKMNDAMSDLEAAVAAGNSDYTAWRELMAVTEQIRKLRETERKLLEAHNATITADQALLIVSSLTAAVREHVTDRKAREAIAKAVERAIGRPGVTR